MALLAPYNDAMKLGSGFNSFTQELCLDNAVIRDDGSKPAMRAVDVEGSGAAPIQAIAQQVTYKTSIVDKVSDIFDNLNINAAFTVKFGKGSVEGGADFLNISKIKNSDLTYMVSCKVINQMTLDQNLTKFSPVSGLKAAEFPRVYGDSFISGFQEGGEFTAIISVRARDRSQANSMKADLAVGLTLDKASGGVDAGIDKVKNELLTENETTISVAWTGGGQQIKKPEDDWTFDTMRAAALRFPDLVAKCPMKTHAVLTKYTSLKSFHAIGTQFNPLSYESARVYTSALRDAFLDYQNISKGLAVLALEVNAGNQKLISQKDKLDNDFGHKTKTASDPGLLTNIMAETGVDSLDKDIQKQANSGAGSQVTSAAATAAAPAAPPSETSSDVVVVASEAAGSGAEKKPETPQEDHVEAEQHRPVSRKAVGTPPSAVNPLVIDKPYPATIYGVESARMQCRFMMNRIVAEVDKVSTHPEIATDESRPLPYMSPFLFNMLLPVGIPLN